MIIIKPLGSKNNSKLLPSYPLGEPSISFCIILLNKLPLCPQYDNQLEKGAPVSPALLSFPLALYWFANKEIQPTHFTTAGK
jgi:hypothetical protein